jgi:hypothetical protein
MLFGLFSPKSPLAVREKAWTEVRMRWLAGQFGLARLVRAAVVLPDDQWFPDDYACTPEDARRFLDRVAAFVQIDPSSIQLEVCEDTEMPGFAGLYQPGLIRLAEGLLADPLALVAVLAHELAHDLLRSRDLLETDLDAEWVADLLPVFLGLGIFTANATLREKCEHRGHHSWWTIRRRGYLNSCVIGHALALFANVDGLVHAILQVAADPVAELRQVFEDCDEESRPQATLILAHCHPVPTGADAPGAWFGRLERITAAAGGGPLGA